jgi:hypothetical protein
MMEANHPGIIGLFEVRRPPSLRHILALQVGGDIWDLFLRLWEICVGAGGGLEINRPSASPLRLPGCGGRAPGVEVDRTAAVAGLPW